MENFARSGVCPITYHPFWVFRASSMSRQQLHGPNMRLFSLPETERESDVILVGHRSAIAEAFPDARTSETGDEVA